MQISTFFINNELYGVDILLVKEIGHLQEVTPIPGGRPHHYGLMNLRGHVISVIHPMLFMDHTEPVIPYRNRLIIFKTDEHLEPLIEQKLIQETSLGNDSLGLIVDRIGDVIEIESTKSILPPTSNIPPRLMRVVSGVVQLEQELVLMLDVVKLYNMICQNTQNEPHQEKE